MARLANSVSTRSPVGLTTAHEAAAGKTLATVALSGPPDVSSSIPPLARRYVAVGDPGVVAVIDVRAMRRIESMPTGAGAHTTALDPARHLLYVFLPKTHRAAIFADA